MDFKLLERQFERMGARIKLQQTVLPARRSDSRSAFTLDIARDRRGEHFLVRLRGSEVAEIQVLNIRPAERHLLLLVRQAGQTEKQKFLCGHDERAWFVAAIPESAHASTVRTAMEALKPVDVKAAQERVHLKGRARVLRKNAAYRRQGEWFFLPCPDLEFDAALIRRNEPLRRGGGKPHNAEQCVRTGGETVYVCPEYPNGLLEAQYRTLLRDKPAARNWKWQILQRGMEVYVRGRISHADHNAITLSCWHRVVMNTENQARAMRSVAFLD